MNMNKVVSSITIQGKAEGLDKLTGDLGKLAAAQQNVATVSETTAKSVLSLEAAWQKQNLRLDASARAQANIARETRLADQALREGLATQQQHAQRLDQIAQRYDQIATSSKQMVAGMTAAGNTGAVASQRMIAGMGAGGEQAAKGIGLARHELINLGRQAQDVGVSLASGQSPFMVLVQQGTQIADVFISSGKSIGSFFNQAIGWGKTFLSSTAGIVTGIAAIGIAAVYAASQFVRASTTIEQALEEQNRLLKEGKALIDARTSAEARSQLQPKELTQFETARNLLDLQNKLNKAREDAERRVSTPTEVPGEMGIAPTAVTGLKEFKSAFDAMKAAQAAGIPALKEYVAELGKIGQARPDLANTIEDMIKLARSGIDLEKAEMTLRAVSDALKGIATDAQLAAVGLGSIAQHKLSDMQANEARDATERQAQATLKVAEAFGQASVSAETFLKYQKENLGVTASIGEVTRRDGQIKGQVMLQTSQMLVASKDQLAVAEAVGVQAKMEAQYRATVNAEIRKGIPILDAIARADIQRQEQQAQLISAGKEALWQLQNQQQISAAVGAQEQIKAQAAATYNQILRDTKDAALASATAAQVEVNALAQINAAHQVTMVSLQGQLSVAQQITGIAQINAQHEATINNLKLQGLSSSQATAQADMQRAISLAHVNTEAAQTLHRLSGQDALLAEASKGQQSSGGTKLSPPERKSDERRDLPAAA